MIGCNLINKTLLLKDWFQGPKSLCQNWISFHYCCVKKSGNCNSLWFIGVLCKNYNDRIHFNILYPECNDLFPKNKIYKIVIGTKMKTK